MTNDNPTTQTPRTLDLLVRQANWFEVIDLARELELKLVEKNEELKLTKNVVEAARNYSVVTVKIQHQGADEILEAIDALDAYNAAREQKL